jgi:hypothetical protein
MDIVTIKVKVEDNLLTVDEGFCCLCIVLPGHGCCFSTKYTESAKHPQIIALELELFEEYYCDFAEDIEF